MKNKIVALNDNLLLILTIIETIIRGNAGVNLRGLICIELFVFIENSDTSLNDCQY